MRWRSSSVMSKSSGSFGNDAAMTLRVGLHYKREGRCGNPTKSRVAQLETPRSFCDIHPQTPTSRAKLDSILVNSPPQATVTKPFFLNSIFFPGSCGICVCFDAVVNWPPSLRNSRSRLQSSCILDGKPGSEDNCDQHQR